MGFPDLNDRERRVLEAVIQSYVETAEPAGSRTISRRFGLGVSPATIRNTMSDLEERGYLFHPHTSAGRIPTDLGYRTFVDGVMRPTLPTETEQERLRLVRRGIGKQLQQAPVRQIQEQPLSQIRQELTISGHRAVQAVGVQVQVAWPLL